VQEDREGARVGSKDNQFRNATVESLGGLVGTFLDLPGVCCLSSRYKSVGRAVRAELTY
jgi:hypothetical protein